MATVQEKTIALTAQPRPVHFPATYYLFIEKRGSIQANARQAWAELQSRIPEIAQQNKITGFLSLVKVREGIYRAGVSLAVPPKILPEGLAYQRLAGGKYRKFILRGSYAQLPEACRVAMKTLIDNGERVRNDFAIENYVNDPQTTPEYDLITEILFPVE